MNLHADHESNQTEPSRAADHRRRASRVIDRGALRLFEWAPKLALASLVAALATVLGGLHQVTSWLLLFGLGSMAAGVSALCWMQIRVVLQHDHDQVRASRRRSVR